tara:strand:- start:67 stop:507 length:441 start_codon:yes stop_codon:yes gene_type:complete
MSEFIDLGEWVPVHTLPGYEACIEYYVNREGQVKSSKGSVERILKHQILSNGYPAVKLTQRIGKGKVLTTCIHKLVAFAFLSTPPTPYGKGIGCTLIHHKDENKLNTSVDNLEWTTRSANGCDRMKRTSGHANRVRTKLLQRRRVK